MFTGKSLFLMLVVLVALAAIGVWSVSAQDPATDDTVPAGCPMLGQGMTYQGGMMHQHGMMGMHHRQGGMGMRGMMQMMGQNAADCPFHEQMETAGGLHDPASCPFYQENVIPEPEATAEPQS